MKIVAIIEARMTSTRLPGKVLKQACGKPLLAHQIERLRKVNKLDQIVIATTINKTDDPVVILAEELEVGFYRGSENDVLARVLSAAQFHHADIIVEILGDCPAIDPKLVSQCIDAYMSRDVDYVSNALERTFPGGMVTQVFSAAILEEVEGYTRKDKHAREHVSVPIYTQPDRYKLFNVVAPARLNRPDLIIELDEPDDYKLIKAIFEHFYPNKKNFDCEDIIGFMDKNIDIKNINLGVVRKWK